MSRPRRFVGRLWFGVALAGWLSCGCSSSPNAQWTMDSGKYSLTVRATYLEVDPANGARITALRVGGRTGRDLLADASVTGQEDNWGSTFWPSPQDWPWPPTDPASIAAINSQPYTATLAGDSLTLVSDLNASAPMLTVTKKLSADVVDEAIVVEYSMVNGGSDALVVAPWEISRVGPGGISFYAADAAPVEQGLPLPPTTEGAGATWYQHSPSDPVSYKLFADAKGWLAHANGDLLLIKSFPDIAAAQSPSTEAEVEIYSAPQYVEVEEQGAAQSLGPGQALHWTVRWYARKLEAPAVSGSAELVTYVRHQLD